LHLHNHKGDWIREMVMAIMTPPLAGDNVIVSERRPTRSIPPGSSPMALQDDSRTNYISSYLGRQTVPQHSSCRKKRILPF